MIIKFCVLQIASDFTDKLLKIVCDPHLHIKGRDQSEIDPPESSHSSTNVQKGDAALDFIKYVCAVLALDQNVQHEILV